MHYTTLFKNVQEQQFSEYLVFLLNSAECSSYTGFALKRRYYNVWRNCEVPYLVGFAEYDAEEMMDILMEIWGWSGTDWGYFVTISKVRNVKVSPYLLCALWLKNGLSTGFFMLLRLFHV